MTNRVLGCLVVFGALVAASTARADITSPQSSVAFGAHRAVGANGMTVNITITNTDLGMVTVTPTISVGAADYTILSAPASLATGASGIVQVRFDPSAPGVTRNGTLNVTASAGAPLNLTLTGSGTQAQIGVGDGNFGNVRTNTTATTNVAIQNTTAGPGQLNVSAAAISGASQPWFAITGTLPQNVNPGATFNLSVTCSPPLNATGTATATITVTSDADLPIADNVGSLSCTAVQASIVVTPPQAFPDTPVNTASNRSFTIANTGTGDLTYTITGFAAPYSVTSGCVNACTVTPGAMRTIGVQFLPTAIGDYPLALTVTHNDPTQGAVPVNLAGRGTGARIMAAPPVLMFGDVDVGSASSPQSVTVMNTGNIPLTISNANLIAGATEYTVTPPADFMTIPPGDVRTWAFACRPTDQGPRPGTFRIQSNSIVTATFDVSLTCTGRRGVLTAPAIFNFNSVSIGQSSEMTLTVTNTGNTTISGVSHLLTNLQQGYSVVPLGPDTLPMNMSAMFTIRFAPLDLTDGGDVALNVTGVWGAASQNTAMAVITLRGTAVTSDFVLEPAGSLDFGTPRYDQAVSRQVCVRNNGQSNLNLESVTVLTRAPTVAGEITLSAFSKGTNCAVGTTSDTFAPVALEMGTTLAFTATWNTRNRAGALDATITVASNAPVAGAVRTLGLVGTSTQGVLEVVGGALVEFGPVDVQSAGARKRITLRNMGDGRLDIMMLAFDDMMSPFTPFLPPSGMASLDPGAELQIDVDYKPVTTRPAGSEESAILHYSMLGGTLGAPSGSVTITGRGIDRAITIDETPDFPPTFRNPGSAGPIAPVTIRNPGEAPLHVTMLMVGDPSWELVDPGAQDFMVPGNGSAEILLRFVPANIGLNTGSLVVMHDDSMEPSPPWVGSSVVDLRGVGQARDVMFAPGPVDVGFTGTNFPIEVDGAIVVMNMDPGNSFTISDLVIEQEGRVFDIVGETQNITLAPLEQRPFTVRFDPQSEAQFSYSASVTLYLDQDMTPHEIIPMVGRSVFVDARGGGGCSTSGGGAGGALAFVLAIVLGRRRKRLTATAIAAAVVAGTTASAVADDVVLSTFDPTPETRPTGFHVQSGEVGDKGMFVAGASVSVATDPLVQDAYGEDSMSTQSVITQSTQIMIGGAGVFFDRWELGAHMPLYQQDGDIADSGMFGIDPVSGTARGDLVLHAKARLIRKQLEGKGRAALAGGLQLTLPTATDGAFAGVKYPTGRALILASLMPGAFSNRLALSGNLGAVLRATSEYANLEQRSGMVFGLSASVRALDRVWLGAEVFGTFVPSGRTDNDGSTTTLSPIEWLAGIKYRPDYRITIGLAAGRGLTSAVGTPALRGVLTVSFTQGAEKLKPIHPPPPPKADPDDDADGLRASVDKCPNEPEDIDQFQDEDGCPDLDNDQDQVPDAKDKCPMEREDLDKYDDLDGCPDPDNDGDGIADSGDQCPQEAEDLDKFQDQDGCPESDNDKDGILDAQDKCPNKPETVNGKQDDDGCPDTGESAIMVSADKLDLLEPISFKAGTATFDKKATNLLGQVAATLRANPDIVKVRITCHVDPTKNPDKDQSLSEDRANAVREWLIKWGISPGRVDVRGFGGKKPLKQGGGAINDRIELIILERS